MRTVDTWMAVAGYAAGVLMGGTLGLIGAGGSILTVPILVYLFRLPPVTATAYSLFVVGATSGVGSLSFVRRRLLDVRALAAFGLPSLLGAFLARAVLVPAIPETIWANASFTLTSDLLILLLFAALMTAAAVSMIRDSRALEDEARQRLAEAAPRLPLALCAIEGLAVGAITGTVGAGGGFLIIPALVLRLRLPMKTAVGTSLVIIAVKSLCGFLGDLSAAREVAWGFLAAFSTFAAAGILLGARLNQWIPGARLRTAFGWLVLAMGAAIFVKELWT
jgi:hypothetical protein